jgi:hypothetical protein
LFGHRRRSVIVRGIDLRDLHKQHFACFHCRKAFKQRGSEEPVAVAVAAPLRPFPCPECGRPMAVMGRDFEAPPQRDRTEWLVAELLQSFGVIFEPGICGPGHRPHKLREAVAFLAERGHDAGVVEERVRQLRSRPRG